MDVPSIWKNPFSNDGMQTLDEYFDALGDKFFEFYKTLRSQEKSLLFSITEAHADKFNMYFEHVHNQHVSLLGEDYVASLYRHGLGCFRISMILTALRIMETGQFANNLICSDNDFYCALELVKILVKHATFIFSTLPVEDKKFKPQPNYKQKFLEALPSDFSRQDLKNTAINLDISDRTAEGWITEFEKRGLIIHTRHGNYSKVKN